MNSEEYRKKLKDPRWQKKRLKIFERDNFTCVHCKDSTTTLHVHHMKYGDGAPWDIDDKWLCTLCEKCHDYNHMIQNTLKSARSCHRPR